MEGAMRRLLRASGFVSRTVPACPTGDRTVQRTLKLIRFFARRRLSPRDTLSAVNRHLSGELPRGLCVSVFYVLLDINAGVMTYASCGHSPMFLRRGATGSVSVLNPRGIALGMTADGFFEKSLAEERRDLTRGDVLVLCTKGLVGTRFGVPGVTAWVRSIGTGPLRQELERLAWCASGSGDMGALVVRFSGAPAKPAQANLQERFDVCRFCGTANAKPSKWCHLCKEPLGPHRAAELALRPDERRCPRCAMVYRRVFGRCPSCKR